MIHDFKNYVLRKEQKYFDTFMSHYKAMNKELSEYKNIDQDRIKILNKLSVIKRTIDDYKIAFEKVNQLIRIGKSTEEIDREVKINDLGAIKAFEEIEKISEQNR